MTSLTVNTDDLSRGVTWVFILAGTLALLAIIIALSPKPEAPVPPMRVLPATDDTTDECPRCGGAGVVDWLDDWDRPVAYDVDCPLCQGTGRRQVVF